MLRRAHSHPCQSCGKKTECPGEYEEDYDGSGVICPEYHQTYGINPDFLCDDCMDRADRERFEMNDYYDGDI